MRISDCGLTRGGQAATKPVNKSSRIQSAKIRRIRVHQRAILRPDCPLMNADAADLRGSGRGMSQKSRPKTPFQKVTGFRFSSLDACH